MNKDLNKDIIIKIFNSAGQLVKLIKYRVNGAGVYKVLWDGKTSMGSVAPTDIYYYQINFGDRQLTGKMMLLK